MVVSGAGNVARSAVNLPKDTAESLGAPDGETRRAPLTLPCA